MSDSDVHSRWRRWQPQSLIEPNSATKDNNEAVISPRDPLPEFATASTVDATTGIWCETQGYEEGKRLGFESGHLEGYRAGEALALEQQHETQSESIAAFYAQQSARFDELFSGLQQALTELESIIPQRLAQFALVAVKSLIGDGTLEVPLQQRLTERLAALLKEEPIPGRNVKLWVSVEDEALIKEQFNKTLGQRGWGLKTDEDMLSGGCRLTDEHGEFDDRIESRWQSLCQLTRAEIAI